MNYLGFYSNSQNKMNSSIPRKRISPLKALFFFIPFGILVIMVGSWMVTKGWEGYQLERRFIFEGISIPAQLIGYKTYTTGGRRSRTGDEPVYSYTTPDGVHRQHQAIEYGIASPQDKEKLATKEVRITYLPDDFEQARVMEWYWSNGPIFGLGYALFWFCSGIYLLIKGFAALINNKRRCSNPPG